MIRTIVTLAGGATCVLGVAYGNTTAIVAGALGVGFGLLSIRLAARAR